MPGASGFEAPAPKEDTFPLGEDPKDGAEEFVDCAVFEKGVPNGVVGPTAPVFGVLTPDVGIDPGLKDPKEGVVEFVDCVE